MHYQDTKFMELYKAPRHRRALRTRRISFLGGLLCIVVTLGGLIYLMLACLGAAPK